MSDKDVTRITELLGRLTRDELGKVSSAVAMLLGGEGVDPAKATPSTPVAAGEDLILETLSRTMSGMGVEHTTVAMLKRSHAYSGFKRQAPGVMLYLTRAGITKRLDQMAVLSIGVRLLYENIGRMGLPASSRTVMNHIARLPSVLNAAFPGYARSGMLHWIIRRKQCMGLTKSRK